MFEVKNKVVIENMLDYTLYDDIDMEDRVFVSWEMFENAVIVLHKNLIEFQENNNVIFDGIYAPPRGGLCLAVKLSYMTNLPMIMDESKITKNTLVVDDCTKSGKTMSKFKDNVTLVMYHNPNSSFTPTIYFKKTSSQINFCWESKLERN